MAVAAGVVGFAAVAKIMCPSTGSSQMLTVSLRTTGSLAALDSRVSSALGALVSFFWKTAARRFNLMLAVDVLGVVGVLGVEEEACCDDDAVAIASEELLATGPFSLLFVVFVVATGTDPSSERGVLDAEDTGPIEEGRDVGADEMGEESLAEMVFGGVCSSSATFTPDMGRFSGFCLKSPHDRDTSRRRCCLAVAKSPESSLSTVGLDLGGDDERGLGSMGPVERAFDVLEV